MGIRPNNSDSPREIGLNGGGGKWENKFYHSDSPSVYELDSLSTEAGPLSKIQC